MLQQCASVSKGVLGNDICALRAGHDGSHRNERSSHLWGGTEDYEHLISKRIASTEARLAALAAAGDALAEAVERVEHWAQDAVLPCHWPGQQLFNAADGWREARREVE